RRPRAASVRCGLRFAQTSEHHVAQLFRCRLLARAGHDLGQGAGDESLALAGRAVLEGFADLCVPGLAPLVAEVILPILTGLVAAAIAHFVLLVVAAAIPRSAAYSASSSRSIRLPRCRRLITVPMGVFMMSAIS